MEGSTTMMRTIPLTVAKTLHRNGRPRHVVKDSIGDEYRGLVTTLRSDEDWGWLVDHLQ